MTYVQRKWTADLKTWLQKELGYDGIVIGSAVVRLIDENKNNPDLVKIVSRYVSEIKKALR